MARYGQIFIWVYVKYAPKSVRHLSVNYRIYARCWSIQLTGLSRQIQSVQKPELSPMPTAPKTKNGRNASGENIKFEISATVNSARSHLRIYWLG